MIDFHDLARTELRSAQQWYRMKSREAAARFQMRVELAIERIAKDPASLPRIGRHHHSIRVSRFPYVLVFRVREEGSAFVVAVAHTSRRSGYWNRRR